jgi:hypothetical protein
LRKRAAVCGLSGFCAIERPQNGPPAPDRQLCAPNYVLLCATTYLSRMLILLFFLDYPLIRPSSTPLGSYGRVADDCVRVGPTYLDAADRFRIARRASRRESNTWEHPAAESWSRAVQAALPPAMILHDGVSLLTIETNSTAAGRHSLRVHDTQTTSGQKRLMKSLASESDFPSPRKTAAPPSCLKDSRNISRPKL